MPEDTPITPEELDAMPFEQALERLESLVAKTETGRLPLEELMTDFETGSRLVNACRGKLDALERKIELLTRDDGKEGQWSNFEADVPSTTRNAPPPEEPPF